MACGSFRSVPEGSGRRAGVPEAQASPPGGPRSRGERESRPTAERGYCEMGRPARGPLRLPQDDQAAGARCERQQGLIVYTINSFILQQNLPNAQLIILSRLQPWSDVS